MIAPKERRRIGAHYTRERDILKVIRSLFLDELRDEFGRIKHDRPALRRFRQKLRDLRFLDPACGCGNFLVVTYRELRLLETELLTALFGLNEPALDAANLSVVDVDAFYGIEVREWPARIAEVAMWLMDHQMNIQLGVVFGNVFERLPLKKSASIKYDNALRCDWRKLLSPARCSFILGNPPFGGKQFGSPDQKQDMQLVCSKIKSSGVLDYVSAWYVKAAEYILRDQNSRGICFDQLDHAGRAGGCLVERIVPPIPPQNSFRASDLPLGERGARQGARPRCDHWLRRF